MNEPICPDCQVTMEGGFPLDLGHGEAKQGTWIEGAPEMSIFGWMKLRGKRKIAMYAWRCPRCTLVRFYAPEDG